MKNVNSMPLMSVAGMMVVGGVVAFAAVHQAFFANQNLDVFTPGREAAIMHLAIRCAVKNAVLIAAAMITGRSCLSGAGEPRSSWRCLLLLVKMAAAVFAASSVSRCVAMTCMRICPSLFDPIAAIGGWRGFQLLDLLLLAGLILALFMLADYVEGRVVCVKSLGRRIALVAFVILVFVGLSAPTFGQMIFYVFGDRRDDVIDDNGGEELRQDDGFRLDADEPWDMKG